MTQEIPMNHITTERSHGILAITVVAALLLGFGGGYVLAKGRQDTHMHSVMSGMTAGLEDKEGADFENAFIDEMITHHEGAIAMAHMVLQKTNRAELVQLANDIISAQTREITLMRGWKSAWFAEQPSVNSNDHAEPGSGVHSTQ